MKVLAWLLLMMVPALAQQMATPSQVAIQIDNAVGLLAQRAEFAEQQVKTLQAENDQLKKELAAKTQTPPLDPSHDQKH